MGEHPVSRTEVVEGLTRELRPKDYARAFWEGGSAAFGRVDRWSDIDLYLLVKEGSSTAAFRSVERALGKLAGISKVYEVSSGWEGVAQKFYTLKRASPFMFIDFAVLTGRTKEKFLVPEIHGRNVFYFDKDMVEGSESLDRRAFGRSLAVRRGRLQARFEMFQNQVQKELNRGNNLEAFEEYRSVVLGTLVELLRMNHTPYHYNFRVDYANYELPRRVVRRLESLSFVKGPSDLAVKYEAASKWARKLLSEQ